MSRVGEKPIALPSGVQVSQEGRQLTVKGPKGTLCRELHPLIDVKVEDNVITCERRSNSKEHRALHGLVRALVNNMVVGVTEGYEKRLSVIGVGYRADIQGKNLALQVGYSHTVVVEPMDGIEFEVGQDTNTRMPFIVVRGIDKETVGQQAAEIRGVKPPEPYKYVDIAKTYGKGIRYEGEYVRHKPGKAGKAGLV